MKILITTDLYTTSTNGVVTSVRNLMEELTKKGHEIRVLTVSEKLKSRQEENIYYIKSLPLGAVYPDVRMPCYETRLSGRLRGVKASRSPHPSTKVTLQRKLRIFMRPLCRRTTACAMKYRLPYCCITTYVSDAPVALLERIKTMHAVASSTVLQHSFYYKGAVLLQVKMSCILSELSV